MVHNSERRDKVTQVVACGTQLLKGKKLCMLGLLVQNSQLRYEVHAHVGL